MGWMILALIVSIVVFGPTGKLLDSRKLRAGDIYNPGHGKRLQIREKNLRVLGYIEVSGKITDKRRRRIGSIEGLNTGQ